MSRAAGEDDVDRETLRAKYELPVFTVSSVDFQKVSGLRRGDGAPVVWREAAGTEIPALRRFVHERTLGWGRPNTFDPRGSTLPCCHCDVKPPSLVCCFTP